MKKFALCAILFYAATANTQTNLVPNPSFEDTLGCPQGYPDLVGKCSNWMPFRITPDYMNDCSSVCGYNNQYGYQQPHSGQAYVGIATYQVTDSTAKEHIGVQFVSPLTIGVKYYLSFYVSPAWNNLLTNIATNKIGVLLTTYQYSDPSGLMALSNSCTFYSDSIITDTSIWHKISGSFIADSAYQYLVIGIFFDDIFIDTINLPYQVVPQVAYYYLDDVCVSTDSAYTETWTEVVTEISSSNSITTYPNPASHNIRVSAINLIEEVEFTNSLGEVVYNISNLNTKEVELSCAYLRSGVYFLKIKTSEGTSTEIIIINH